MPHCKAIWHCNQVIRNLPYAITPRLTKPNGKQHTWLKKQKILNPGSLFCFSVLHLLPTNVGSCVRQNALPPMRLVEIHQNKWLRICEICFSRFIAVMHFPMKMIMCLIR